MEKPKKKLVIFMPSMEGGGVEKNIIIISNYLSRYLKNTSLITFDKKFNKKFSKKIDIKNLNFDSTKKYSKYFKYFMCLLVFLKIILKDRNIVLFAFQANIYCIILCKIFDIPVIVRSNSSPSGWTQNIFKNLLFNFFFKLCNALIVNSHEFKREIDRKFNINSKVIYNPLNKNEIIQKSFAKNKFTFFDKKKTLKIINIARFTDQKDQITLLRAFKIVQSKINAKLLLIGYGVNENLLLNYIKNNKLKKKVKIINYKDNPFPYLKKSNLFILSSLYEGLPNVLLEALTLKKFIISSDCPTGPKEILKKGMYGFLFKMKDYKDLAKKIILYENNKSFFNKRTIKGYKSLSRFDFKKNCDEYLSIVRKFL